MTDPFNIVLQIVERREDMSSFLSSKHKKGEQKPVHSYDTIIFYGTTMTYCIVTCLVTQYSEYLAEFSTYGTVISNFGWMLGIGMHSAVVLSYRFH